MRTDTGFGSGYRITRKGELRSCCTRERKDSQYVQTNISTFSDAIINGKQLIWVFCEPTSMIALEDENYFEAGDTVSVILPSI
jgi:hypothetical protein